MFFFFIEEWFERRVDSVEKKVHGLERHIASAYGLFCEQTSKDEEQFNEIFKQGAVHAKGQTTTTTTRSDEQIVP